MSGGSSTASSSSRRSSAWLASLSPRRRKRPRKEDVARGKAALTELFQQVKNEKTPVVVERVVADIDEIVRLVRFPGWQTTAAGEREVKKALRKSLLKY